MLSQYFIVIVLPFNLIQCSDIIINIVNDDGPVKVAQPPRDACTLSTCEQFCRNLEFAGGVCMQGKCICELNLDNDPSKNLFEPLERCNFVSCDQLCRRLGFPGGVCVGDRCKCDNFKEMTHVKDLFTRTAICDPTLCNLLCIRVKHHGGKCTKGHCICYKTINNNEDVKSMIESRETHHNVIVAEEPGVTVPRSCDAVRCDDMCHRLNYAGGMCEGGNCQCY